MLENILKNEKFNRVVKARDGYLLYNKNDIYIGKSIEEYGEFSYHETALFEQICKEGDVVIEIGANIGAHTLSLAKLVKQKGVILAFEPQRVVFQTLCANLALNSITNVHTFQMALSNEEGYVAIPEIDYSKQGNFGGISVDKFKVGTPVKKEKLDSFKDKISRLKLIKIDVEGMEKEVIEGSKEIIQKFKPFLYIENDRQENSKELIQLVKSLGYRLYWHLPTLFNKNNFAKNENNIFKNIVSVNMLCIHKDFNINVEKMTEITDSSFHPMAKGKK
ncbi:FkbM family methyltransferase [Malaciobacter mytili]|uniref:FkbM family methyltransferase n=1 Tax=Malaciobacter mytili TaxID=603050 RepID=UPI003A8AD280